MKRPVKTYLSSEEYNTIKSKAQSLGFVGNGWLSRFLLYVCSNPVVVVDSNVKRLLEALHLGPYT